MTQAPTPGPLSGDDVKPGDLLRHERGLVIVRLVEPDVGLHVGYAWTDGVQLVDIFENFTFIGRPDESGWMPWSGGENPVPGQRVDFRLRDGTEGAGRRADDYAWEHEGGLGDIIAFRLAPTAPVEASGSELARAIADGFFNGNQGYDDCNDMMRLSFDMAAEAVLKLRPQPSGETREAVAHEIYDFLNERFPDGPMPGGVQLFADPGDHTDASMKHEAGCTELADRILALRPAPVASGGQHSSGEGFDVSDDCTALNIICDPGIITGLHTAKEARDWIEESVRAALRNRARWLEEVQTADTTHSRRLFFGDPFRLQILPIASERRSPDEPCSCFGDSGLQGSTHHDANDKERCDLCGGLVEAPVAETAGEVVAWITKTAVENWMKGDDAEAHVLLRKGGDLRVALYTAPVPAQDDDRVREVVTGLVSEIEAGRYSDTTRAQIGVPVKDLRVILAALKSTAAQGGGSK